MLVHQACIPSTKRMCKFAHNAFSIYKYVLNNPPRTAKLLQHRHTRKSSFQMGRTMEGTSTVSRQGCCWLASGAGRWPLVASVASSCDAGAAYACSSIANFLPRWRALTAFLAVQSGRGMPCSLGTLWSFVCQSLRCSRDICRWSLAGPSIWQGHSCSY